MTRVNIILIDHGKKYYFNIGSDCYPETIIPWLKELVRRNYVDMAHFFGVNPAGNLQLGKIGNPYFIYEVDLDNGIIRAWSTQVRWRNAPEDWRARGWNCWLGENGKYGFPVWVKGKRVEVN